MTFEALQRYLKLNHGETLPTVLVMEEAHTFIKRYKEDVENQDAATVCCQVFERIAREGRKFGLGSSFRPSGRASCRPRCFRSATPFCCTGSATTVIRSWCTGWSRTT